MSSTWWQIAGKEEERSLSAQSTQSHRSHLHRATDLIFKVYTMPQISSTQSHRSDLQGLQILPSRSTDLTFKIMDIQSVHKLSPPGLAPRVGSTLQVILGQFPCQVDEGHSNSLGLPLQTQCCAKTVRACVYAGEEEGEGSHSELGQEELREYKYTTPVVHKCPGHLHQFFNLPLIACNQGNQTR